MSLTSLKYSLYLELLKYKIINFFTKPAKKYKVIFKADDLVDGKNNVAKLDKILQKENIKISWGIIGVALDMPNNEEFIEFLKIKAKDEKYHFFNHGYSHRYDLEKNQFEFTTPFEKQYETIKETQDIVREKTGIVLNTFGAPCEALNEDTIKAIEQFDEIKYIYYGLPNVSSSKMILKKPSAEKGSIVLEKDVGDIDCYFLKQNWDSLDEENVIVLQIHPYKWDYMRFLHFKVCVAFLKSKGVEFIVPSDIGV